MDTAAPLARLATDLSSELLDLDSAEIDRANAALRELRQSGAIGELFHDPHWLRAIAMQPDFKAQMVVCRSQGRTAGLLPLVIYPSTLNLQIGEFVFLSWSVTRITIYTAPLIAPDVEVPAAVLGSLFSALADSLHGRSAVFVEAVTDGSELSRQFLGRASYLGRFHVLPFGKPYQHRTIALAQSYEGYLKQLSSKTRSDLKRTRRRFIEAVGEDYRVRCFTTRSDVPDFVRDAVALSEKTYQHQHLGGGLRSREQLTEYYRIAADLGWFRSYILYIGEKAAAFQVGLVHEGVFQAREIGYDQEFARLQVGIFLHTEILEDLCGLEPAVRAFDFGHGDTLHKQRLSTDTRTERFYYLFAKDLSGTLAYHCIERTNALSSLLGRLAAHLGLLKKLRAWIRRHNARQ